MAFEEDLGQDRAGQVLAGLAVAHDHGMAGLDGFLHVPQRHVSALAAVVQAPVGIADDRHRLGFRRPARLVLLCGGHDLLLVCGNDSLPGQLCGIVPAGRPIAARLRILARPAAARKQLCAVAAIARFFLLDSLGVH